MVKVDTAEVKIYLFLSNESSLKNTVSYTFHFIQLSPPVYCPHLLNAIHPGQLTGKVYGQILYIPSLKVQLHMHEIRGVTITCGVNLHKSSAMLNSMQREDANLLT